MMNVGSHVGLEVVAHALLRDAEQRHGHQHAQRERRRGRERTGRRLVAGNDGAEAGRGDEQEERAQKAEILLRVGRPTSSICFSMPVTTISRRFCQRERSDPW
jgi:hypothetical protein